MMVFWLDPLAGTAIPEPASFTLLMLGSLALLRRRLSSPSKTTTAA